MNDTEVARQNSSELSAFVAGLPSFKTLIVSADPDTRSIWYWLNPGTKGCFTPNLLLDIRSFQERVADWCTTNPAAKDELNYLVALSAVKGVWNLGGDLGLFCELIRSRDRAGLLQYGKECIDAVYANTTHLGVTHLTTMCVVQGLALGGGAESSLSGNLVIAERQARFSFPEVSFGSFPGMGAYSLLRRRVGPAEARRIITSASEFTAAQFYEMGIVDVLVEDGDGVVAARKHLRLHAKRRNGLQGFQLAVERADPIPYEELLDVVTIWVDTALQATNHEIRHMEKIVARQSKLLGASPDAPRTSDRAKILPLPGIGAPVEIGATTTVN